MLSKKSISFYGIGLGALMIFLLIIVVSQTECNEYVDEISMNFDFLKIIDAEITKKCKGSPLPTSISEDKAELILNARNEYVIKSGIQDTLKEKAIKIGNETIVLERLVAIQPNIVPILENKEMELDEIKSQLTIINSEVESLQIQLSKQLETVALEFVSEEQKQKELCKINPPFVELDQKIYTWTDKVYITIVDLCVNTDPNKIEYLGTEPGRGIIISSKSGNILNYTLWETGFDTGIFTGEVILTGFSPYDANGDGESIDATGTTFGKGFDDGLFSMQSEDSIVVSYQHDDDSIVYASSLVNWNIGELQFLEAQYQVNDPAIIRVVDPDLNFHPERIDSIKVNVSSETDPDGIVVTLRETNEATGIFEHNIGFTLEHKSAGLFLKVSLGDKVVAKYIDRTLPEPYQVGDTLEITGSMKISEKIIP